MIGADCFEMLGVVVLLFLLFGICWSFGSFVGSLGLLVTLEL